MKRFLYILTDNDTDICEITFSEIKNKHSQIRLEMILCRSERQ